MKLIVFSATVSQSETGRRALHAVSVHRATHQGSVLAVPAQTHPPHQQPRHLLLPQRLQAQRLKFRFSTSALVKVTQGNRAG